MQQQKQYESLIVWKEAHSLCIEIYAAINTFPTEERFGLCQQIRRSSYSVPMNIVEGNVKRSQKEKLRFIEIAEGSLDELDYQILLSRDLGYMTNTQCATLRGHIARVAHLLGQFRRGIREKNKQELPTPKFP